MARIPIIAGNWKMNTTMTEAVQLVDAIRPRIEGKQGVEKVLCPPFISLAVARERLLNSDVLLGAQDMYWEEKGAFTGEVSPLMLEGLVDYVIIGHSERRQLFGETDETVGRKVRSALNHGLKPIMCVGESLHEYEASHTDAVVGGQVRAGLEGIPGIGSLVIAYEPIWAIGTGRASTGEGANKVIGMIRETVSSMYGAQVAGAMRIQYGGSVTAENIEEIMGQPEIDGALVGGASLKADAFVEIVLQSARIKSGG